MVPRPGVVVACGIGLILLVEGVFACGAREGTVAEMTVGLEEGAAVLGAAGMRAT